MVIHGPYRSKIQLPRHFIPELPLNPWPTFDELYGFDDVRRAALAGLGDVKAEFWSEEVQGELDYTHDTECILAFDDAKEVEEQYWKRIEAECPAMTAKVGEEDKGGDGEGLEGERGEGEGAEEEGMSMSAICNLHNEISKKHHVHRISYNKISPRGRTKGHFGESNTFLNVLASLGAAGCLKVTVGKSEAVLKEDELMLFDDSFFTMIENLCDIDATFLRIDVRHPQLILA